MEQQVKNSCFSAIACEGTETMVCLWRLLSFVWCCFVCLACSVQGCLSMAGSLARDGLVFPAGLSMADSEHGCAYSGSLS